MAKPCLAAVMKGIADPERMQAHQWYALRTVPRHEKRVRDRIRDSSFECFLPLQRRSAKWKNGVRATVETPLFPTYMFVWLRADQCRPILKTPGVVSLVGTPGAPWPVPAAEIDMLRAVLPEFNPVSANLPIAGEHVRIVSGPLSGICGIVLRGSGPLRVVLTVSAICQGVAVEVGLEDIETLPFHAN